MNFKEILSAIEEQRKAISILRAEKKELLMKNDAVREESELNALTEAIRTNSEALAEGESRLDKLLKDLSAAQGSEEEVIEEGRNLNVVGSYTTGTASRAEKDNSRQEKLYRTAWLKKLAIRDGRPLFGELTSEERDAYITTTSNTGAVVPQNILNEIIELVESLSPMYNDAKKTNMSQGFSVPRHKGIKKGDATSVQEGTANPDAEENEFDSLILPGVDITKYIVLSRRMKFQTIEAFEEWVKDEMSARLAAGREAVIRARLNGTAPTGGSVVDGSGIARENIVTNQTYSDATIRAIFAKLKGKGQKVVYANSDTIWNNLAGIENEKGEKLFVPNSMVDVEVEGRIYGAGVTIDDTLPDNVVYFGVKGQLWANDFSPLELFPAIEPKTANDITTGYVLFDAGLANPKGFVKATFGSTPSV